MIKKMKNSVLGQNLIISIFTCFTFAANSGAADFTMSKDEKSVIVVPEKASITENFAAQELQRYLLKITNRKIPIKNENRIKKDSGKYIYIGNTDYGKELKKQISGKDLEAFIIAENNGNMILMGNCDRAGLYAVYTFLEQLGCRWLAPGIEIVPQHEKISINGVCQIHSPGIKYRTLRYLSIMRRGKKSRYWEAKCIDWAVKNKINMLTDEKLNSKFPEMIMKRGGIRGINNTHVPHYVFTEKLYKKHPDIFARNQNGDVVFGSRKRKGFGQQFCLSNENSVLIYANMIKNYVNLHPDVELFPITQADGIKYCECEKCRKLYAKSNYCMGKPDVTKAWMDFVGKVAAIINRDHPNKKFYTLAYGRTKNPPDEDININKNLIVVITHNVDFFHQYTKSPKSDFLPMYKKWRKIVPSGVGIYDYYPFSTFKHLPLVAIKKLVFDIRTAHSFNCPYFEIQSSSLWAGMYLPIYYAGAMAMWNPAMEWEKEMDLFYKGMYGESADKIKEFFQILEHARESYPRPYAGDLLAYLTKEVIASAEEPLNQAWNCAEKQETKERLQPIIDHFNFAKHLRLGRDAYISFNASNNVKFAEEAVSHGNEIKKLVKEIEKAKGTRFDLGLLTSIALNTGRSGVGTELGCWYSAKNNFTLKIPSKSGIRVGILTDTFGSSGMFTALSKVKGINPIKLSTLNRNVLNSFQVIIINNTKGRGKWFNSQKNILRDWVENGGGLILLHNAVGFKRHEALFPEIGKGINNPRLKSFKIKADHEINKGLKSNYIYEHGYYDHISINPGKNGKSVIVDEKNNAVVVAGRMGKGGVVLDGMLTGYGTDDDLSYYDKEPVGGELQVLVNSIIWLSKIRKEPAKLRTKDIGIVYPVAGKSNDNYYKRRARFICKFYNNNTHKAELIPVSITDDLCKKGLENYKNIVIINCNFHFTNKMKNVLSDYVSNGGLLFCNRTLRDFAPLGVKRTKGLGTTKKIQVKIECPLTENLIPKKWMSHKEKIKVPRVSGIDAVEVVISDISPPKPYKHQPYLSYKVYGKGALIYINSAVPANKLDQTIFKNCVSQKTHDWLILP